MVTCGHESFVLDVSCCQQLAHRIPEDMAIVPVSVTIRLNRILEDGHLRNQCDEKRGRESFSGEIRDGGTMEDCVKEEEPRAEPGGNGE